MTRRERKIVKDAITELMADEGDFNDAIAKLCGLVGLEYPANKVLQVATLVDIPKLASGPNQSFEVKRNDQ